MKKNVLKTVSKLLSIITVFSVLSMTAWSKDKPEQEQNPDVPLVVTISGTISHDNFRRNQSGTVSFNRFPASVDEFLTAQQQIGGEPHGAVALELMAIEMYRRNAELGTECLKLCNTPLNVNAQTRRLRELFGNDANYNRPYQVAAFLKGATPENKYTPNEPYTVEVKVNNGRPYQKITDYQSTELYLEVLTKGKAHGSETVYVVKPNPCRDYPEGSKYFLVNNCPGLYAQVQEIFDMSWDKLK